MFKKVLVAVLMLALLASGVGLGIHILHKEALANGTTFRVRIIWVNDEDVFDDEIDQVVVRTREFAEGPVLDQKPLIYQGTEGVISLYKFQFIPNSASVVWEVEIFSELQFTDNPQVDGDDVIHNGMNTLDNEPHHIP